MTFYSSQKKIELLQLSIDGQAIEHANTLNFYVYFLLITQHGNAI